ncbi:hypothetical protein [uncultured Ruegeria sp.]|uniref:hypothetical protein n=1 Tax=uncultured Ruegeria sp. TaxID=259304 RepID=UPI00345BC4F6
MDGNDRLEGGGGADILTGGRSQEFLVGGAGADNFAFRRGDGVDRITEFQDGTDIISFTGQYISIDDVFIFHDPEAVYVVCGPGDEIVIEGAEAGSVTEDDFAF